jgi:hypothetical protein
MVLAHLGDASGRCRSCRAPPARWPRRWATRGRRRHSCTWRGRPRTWPCSLRCRSRRVAPRAGARAGDCGVTVIPHTGSFNSGGVARPERRRRTGGRAACRRV